MVQSFWDKFGAGKKKQVLKRPALGKILANKDQSKYQSEMGKMMHIMRWCRMDIYNATCNNSRHMMLPGRTHYNAMVCIMDYCITNPERGLVLKLHGDLDRISTDYKFEVMVKTDSTVQNSNHKMNHDRKCGVPE